jgi:protein-tyrosine-phosphatase/predicted ATP-grasp superfamily ATP-dependent carboligase
METERYDLVIPCHDHAVIPMQVHREELAESGRAYTLNETAFGVFFDKIKTCELAASLGIRVPKGRVVSDVGQVDSLEEEFAFPAVLKPRSSHTIADLDHRQHVRKAEDRDQLRDYLATMLLHGEVLVQENFPGRGAGVEILASGGKILVAFQHERVHEPFRGGGSSYRTSVPLDPELLDATSKLVDAVDYEGVAMVEFKIDPSTGAWALIEVNARFWGSLPLAVAAGVDFPYYLYELLVEGKTQFPQSYTTGLYCRNLQLDTSWLLGNLRADKSDPTLATVPLRRVAAETKNVLLLRERSDTFVLDDPKPGLVEAWRVAGELLGRIPARLESAFAARPAVRRRRSRALRSRVAGAHSVLFVCKGNICRSPFAEHYARGVFPPRIAVSSCGYYPVMGRESPREAVLAARSHGVDLSRHRSRPLSARALRDADIVFVFDEENRDTVRREYPFARSKTFLLGALEEAGNPVIADPLGGSVEGFRASYRTTAGLVDVCTRLWE